MAKRQRTGGDGKIGFPKVIDFIEAWTPACGILDLKEYADLQAKQRKNAKDKGYI